MGLQICSLLQNFTHYKRQTKKLIKEKLTQQLKISFLLSEVKDEELTGFDYYKMVLCQYLMHITFVA